MFLERSGHACWPALYLLGFCALSSGDAVAQSAGGRLDEAPAPTAPPWVIVPVTSDEVGKWMLGATDAIAAEWERKGGLVLMGEEASARFEDLDSSPAPELSQSDIDRWVNRSQAAVRYLAHGDYRGARRELQATQRLADRAAAELNREAARAQQVLDTCLYMVRAYVETNNRAAAKEQAHECRRLVPRVEPTAFRHTPEVRELLGQVDRELAIGGPGSLEVQSEPSNCLVRVNGIAFGHTPIADIELPVGTYRLQVECEESRRGRVQVLRVSSGVNHIFVDARFQKTVHSRPQLYLQYEEPAEEERHRMPDGRRIAETLGATGTLVMTRPSPGTLRIDLQGKARKPASVWLPIIDGALMGEDVERAVEALLEGRSSDFSGAAPIAALSWQQEQAETRRTEYAANGEGPERVEGELGKNEVSANRYQARPHGQRVAGWTLFGVGGASLLSSVGLHLYRGKLGDDLIASPSNLSVARDWQDIRIAVWTTAGLGGASLLSAMPLLLPETDGVPWWAWLSGGLGLGLAGYAVYEGVGLSECDEPFVGSRARATGCVDRGQETGRLALSLAGAAPLLTVPLVYLLRPLRVKPSIAVNDGGAMFSVRRSF